MKRFTTTVSYSYSYYSSSIGGVCNKTKNFASGALLCLSFQGIVGSSYVRDLLLKPIRSQAYWQTSHTQFVAATTLSLMINARKTYFLEWYTFFCLHLMLKLFQPLGLLPAFLVPLCFLSPPDKASAAASSSTAGFNNKPAPTRRQKQTKNNQQRRNAWLGPGNVAHRASRCKADDAIRK